MNLDLVKHVLAGCFHDSIMSHIFGFQFLRKWWISEILSLGLTYKTQSLKFINVFKSIMYSDWVRSPFMVVFPKTVSESLVMGSTYIGESFVLTHLKFWSVFVALFQSRVKYFWMSSEGLLIRGFHLGINYNGGRTPRKN